MPTSTSAEPTLLPAAAPALRLVGRRTPPHLELVPLETAAGPQVRLWHSPERWGQVPASALDLDDEFTPRRLVERCGLFPPAQRTPHRILLLGCSPLAALIADRLLSHTDHTLRLWVPTPLPGRSPRRTAISWQAGLAAGTHRDRVRLVRSDPTDTWQPDELVVVASETIEVDRVMLARLSRRGVPHVVVMAHRDRAVLGPWVDPGVPACLSCLDHWRTRDDRDYPDVLARLSRRPAVTEGAASEWAATTLATHLCRPDGGRTALASQLLVNDLADLAGPCRQHLEPHPRCRAHQPLDSAFLGGRADLAAVG